MRLNNQTAKQKKLISITEIDPHKACRLSSLKKKKKKKPSPSKLNVAPRLQLTRITTAVLDCLCDQRLTL